jgi:hypothetical protein
MTSRPRAAVLMPATLLGSFLLVLVFGGLLGTTATAKPTPNPTPTGNPTAPPSAPAPVRLVVGAGQLAVDGAKVQPFPGVTVWVQTAAGATQLCLTTPDGAWTPAGTDWRTSTVGGARVACRPVEKAALAEPVTIGLSHP